MGELPPITTSTFTIRSPKNMPLTKRASISANPDPVISPSFVESNYEVLESILKDRRRQVYNEDLRTELDYYSEEYDEEREMEPRPLGARETTPVLQIWSLHLHTTYKGLMEKTYTLIEAKEVATNGALNDHKEGFNRSSKGFSLDNNIGKEKNQDRFSPYKGSDHGLLTNLSKSPKEILVTEKYCHFHKDDGHETNQCWKLRHQIEEAVKSGQLAHLVKGIKKGTTKAFDTQLSEWKKGDKDIVSIESPIPMINRGSPA
nr:hypothetical protein [Tanacetum cinerariifolium]